MDGIPDSAPAWIWWVFSVIIVSLLVNIASAYAKPFLDLLGVKYSERRRTKITETQKQFDLFVESYNSPEGITYLKLDLLIIYIKIAIVLVGAIASAEGIYNFIRVLGFLRLFPDFLFISNEFIRVGIYLVGLAIILFFLDRVRLINSVIKEVYSKNPKLKNLSDRYRNPTI